MSSHADPPLGEVFAHQRGTALVSSSEIGRFVEAYELDDPRFEQGVAPASMVLTFLLPPYWRPGEPSMRPGAMPGFAWTALGRPGEEMMATSVDLVFHREVTVGMQLAADYRLESVTPKRTSVGEGEFLQLAVEVGELLGPPVVTMALTVYRYRPHEVPA